MAKEKDILSQLTKSEKPEVSKEYFKKFEEKIMAEIGKVDVTSESNNLLDNLPRSPRAEVPEEFFRDFPEKMVDIATNSDKNGGRIIAMRFLASIAGAAAVILFCFWIFNKTENDTTELAETEAETTEYNYTDEDYDAYLSYVDEGEIIDFIVENEISIEDKETVSENDQILDYVGDDIEDLYYEL